MIEQLLFYKTAAARGKRDNDG